VDGEELLEIAMGTAAALPAVTHEHPFGPEYEVFTVAGKVFLLATEAPDRRGAAPADPRDA
jgi:predicted DNA-binding protein (MmcQ/YjbR family)